MGLGRASSLLSILVNLLIKCLYVPRAGLGSGVQEEQRDKPPGVLVLPFLGEKTREDNCNRGENTVQSQSRSHRSTSLEGRGDIWVETTE